MGLRGAICNVALVQKECSHDTENCSLDTKNYCFWYTKMAKTKNVPGIQYYENKPIKQVKIKKTFHWNNNVYMIQLKKVPTKQS